MGVSLCVSPGPTHHKPVHTTSPGPIMSDYVANTRNELKSQSRYAVSTAQDAVHSRAWLYPIKGIIFFLSHKACWGPFIKTLPPAMAMSAAILGFMFTFTYLPQAAFLSVINFGPIGFISAIPLVLSESYIIFQTLSKAFILDQRTAEVFDRVLVERQLTSLVQQGREVQGQGATKKFGKVIMSPLAKFQPSAIAYYLLTLPLNFIPVVGTVVFFLLNGAKTGPGLHERYFQLKKFSQQQRKEQIKKRRGAYTGMGTAALLLQVVPVLNVLFAFSNAAGAALFAADLEKGTDSLKEDVRQQ